MLDLEITIHNGPEIQQRLANLARAAEVFGASRVSVGATASYAGYVIEGTRPHDIYPRSARALFWPGARHPVGHVHHPGTKANPFLQRAIESTSAAIAGYVADQLDMVATGAGSNYSQILTGAGNLLLNAARQEAPVRTGNLRQSLYMVDGR